jgi:hypothetical protein
MLRLAVSVHSLFNCECCDLVCFGPAIEMFADAETCSSPCVAVLDSAHHLGAIVIGTTSTIEKAEVAKRAGADHVVLYGNRTMDDVVKDIKALTPNQEGVHAVYDGVGKDTFLSDFEVVRRWVIRVLLSVTLPLKWTRLIDRKATLVILGAASGPVPAFEPLKLMRELKTAPPFPAEVLKAMVINISVRILSPLHTFRQHGTSPPSSQKSKT